MKVICDKRASGKTTRLIEMASGKRYYIVCANHQEAANITRKADEMGKVIFFPITYDNFIHKEYYGVNIDGFLIDNVDSFLQYLSEGVEIKAFTVTTE